MDKPSNSLRKTAWRWGLGGFAATLVAMGGIQLQAQGIAAHNSRAPVNWSAATIDIQDRQNRVSLTGNVVVTQAGLRVSAQRMLVNYSDAGSLEIDRITAIGGVQVSRGNETATGDTAIYDFDRRIITLSGNVRLASGQDKLQGGRLVMDLSKGSASVDGSANGGQNGSGRVSGTFSVPQN